MFWVDGTEDEIYNYSFPMGIRYPMKTNGERRKLSCLMHKGKKAITIWKYDNYISYELSLSYINTLSLSYSHMHELLHSLYLDKFNLSSEDNLEVTKLKAVLHLKELGADIPKDYFIKDVYERVDD